jgi:hypothetical protein
MGANAAAAKVDDAAPERAIHRREFHLVATAHFNAFHLWHPPTINKAYRMREELAPKLCGPVDMLTREWTWKRIARTGVDGERITESLGPEFQECVAPGTVDGAAGRYIRRAKAGFTKPDDSP